jgi:type VI secretion system secreted protein VgrG
MPEHKQANRPVRIRTPLGEDALLVRSLTGSERLGRPFQYNLVLLSEDHELDYKKIIGQNVTVFVDKGDKEPRYFNGYISRFAQTKYERKLAEYDAVVVPWLWFLTRSSDCRIFQNKTIPEILKQVFQDHGFSDMIDRLHGTYRKWDYCVQYRESAFDFVSRLMEEEGIYYFFKHETDRHSIVLCDSPASHKQFGGYEDLLYRPSSGSVQETLWSWVVAHEVQPGGYATTNFDFTKPRRTSLANSALDRSHGQSQFEQFDYLGEQSPFNEGERYSKLRLEERQAEHETYSGEGDARGVCTGVRFTLKGHPRKEFEKEYLTTGADYAIRSDPLEPSAEKGDEFDYQAKLTAMPLEEQFRAPRVTPKPIVYGPQTAIVVGPEGEKIYTDQYGRVKVHFHWDRHGLADENASCWIRVSQGWAGKPKGQNWGDMAIPHIGDEVIVECLEGDPDRPIITGRVYNQSNMAPMGLPTNKHKRVWADDFGNEMVFDATPGDEHILLRSPHHNSGITLGRSATGYTESNTTGVTLGDTATCTLGAGVTLTAGGTLAATVGTSIAGVLGFNAAINVGPQLGMNIGPQFTFTRGIKYESSWDDDYKICDKNYIISAGGVLNLVGGSGPQNGSSIIYANDDKIELTVGDAVTVTPAAHAASIKNLNILSIVCFLAATGVMAGAAGYVDSYNPDPNEDAPDPSKSDMENKAEDAKKVEDYSNLSAVGKKAADDKAVADKAAKDDKHLQRQTDSLNKQAGFETAAGVAFAAGCLSMLKSYLVARSERMETPISSHTADAAATRLQLDRTGMAVLDADSEVSLLGNERKALIKVGGTAKIIKIENQNGDISIMAGTSEIKIVKSGAITISGNTVVKGKLDVADGALSVAGVAVPAVSDLASVVAKMKAADAKDKAAKKVVKLHAAVKTKIP